MIITADNKLIRYTGRWDINETMASSSANGNYFEFKFIGETAVIGFNIKNCKTPFPHLFISVDNGARVEAVVDRYIRVSADYGEHCVKVILKSSVERQSRWSGAVEAMVTLSEIESENFVAPDEDTRKVIEFIGDSITEGISIDTHYVNYETSDDMVYWDDSTAGYAYLTAKLLDMRPVIMGYGCLGTLSCGAGGIPPVEESYPFYSDNRPMDSTKADYIVINHGTNDRKKDKEDFKNAYYSFLKSVRKRNPDSIIISVTPYSGCLAEEIKESVNKYNEDFSDSVFYINSTGWVPKEPLHPVRESHKIIATKLSEIIKERFTEGNL
ncbi:MAG: hypothetical protein J6A69_09130 [Clostridia bacterium]|nr:hypothetical protein [Clostridia bacterium]